MSYGDCILVVFVHHMYEHYQNLLIGVAFQLVDDLLDFTASADQLGRQLLKIKSKVPDLLVAVQVVSSQENRQQQI